MGSTHNTCFATITQEPTGSHIQWSAVLMVNVYRYNPAGTKAQAGTVMHHTDNRQKFKFPMQQRLT